MNQSVGVLMSAESVAAANEPSPGASGYLLRLPRVADLVKEGATPLANLLTSRSIHQNQQRNSTRTALPAPSASSFRHTSQSLLSKAGNNLVAALISEQQQHHLALSLTSTSASDTDQQLSPFDQRIPNSTSFNPMMMRNNSITSDTQQPSAAAASNQLMQQQQQQQQSFNDWWNEYWSRQPFPSGYTQSSITLLACLITTIIFLIVVGNLLVCIAIFTEKSLKPTQNWFIASLAVSDMLLGLVVMPFSLARELMGFWIFGPFWCDIHEAMDVLLSTASINTLCLISLDRYWSITQAVNYLKKRTPRRSALMIAFVWVFSAAVSLPPLFGWKKQSPSITAPNTTQTTTATATTTTTTTSIPIELTTLQDQAWRRRRDELATPFMQDSYESEPLANENNNFLPASSTTPAYFASETTTISSQQQPSDTEYPSCQLSDDIGYVLYSAFGSFFIPCAVMVFTYIKIFLAARSRARRAISKQSRAAGAANKRAAAAHRRNQQQQQQPAAAAAISHSAEVAGSGSPALQKQQSALSEQVQTPPPLAVRGKIVIVESRRKSLAPVPAQVVRQSVVAANNKPPQVEELNRATYTCSDLVRAAAASEENGDATCTLTTSGVKQASASVLNQQSSTHSASTNTDSSSMITVMNSSMAEVPVTRFNFTAKAGANCLSADREAESRKTAALLQAFSQVASGKELCNNEEQLLRELCDEDQHNSIDVEAGWKGQEDYEDPDDDNQLAAAVNTATNETCFMTIEEDSDMFDAQAGRTITMIAGNASQKRADSLAQSKGLLMTMQPALGDQHQQHQQPFVCNNMVCRRQQQHHNRSASSYCGSSLTINDQDDDIDIDECDDEMLTDDCNGYSVSCGQSYTCPNATFCARCHECERERELEQQAGNNHHPSLSGNGARVSGGGSAKQLVRMMSEQNNNNNNSDTMMMDNRSMTGDDNLSLTEYRSNEESTSSTTGHDVLDATEPTPKSEKRKSIAFGGGQQQSFKNRVTIAANEFAGNNGEKPTQSSQRKKSVIGFRLSRLGSSTALTTHSGGLLALATSQQQQQQAASGNATGRNLKALRQNFFLKLNQLTAGKNESKRYRPTDEVSPTGKSSAQSSGTSFEPSVDCATTSNVQSADYPLETTIDTDYAVKMNSGEEQTTGFGQLPGAQHKPNEEKEGAACNHPSDKQSPGNRQTGDSGIESKTGHSDKSDDRALLLHRSNHQPSPISANAGAAQSKPEVAASHKQTMLSVSGGGGDSQRSKVASSMGSQINHSNMVSSTTAGGGGGGVGGGSTATGRAYLASDNERHKRKLAKARERRATLILGLIMAAFICSWLPFFTFYVMRAVCVVCRDYITPRFEALIFWLGYCNSAINPIIYTIFNRDFRKAFRKILFKCL